MSEHSSDTTSRREWFVRAAAAVSGIAAAHTLAHADPPAATPTCPAGGGIPQAGAALPDIGEISSGSDRVLRATITVEDEIRAVWTAMPNTLDADQFNKSTCREGYAMRYFAGAPTGGKRAWPVLKGVPGPGPTLRARVGDTVQIILLNHVDVKNFPASLDLAEQGKSTGCDSSATLVGDPGQENRQQMYPAGDEEPDCFHGSSSANLHFHGFHISPGTVCDNVLVQVRPSPRDPRSNQPLVTEASVRKAFQEVFDACGHGHGPHKWEDLPKAWRDSQEQLLKAYDAQVPLARLWDADQKAIAAGEWPQYYVGAYPNCFRITPEKMPVGPEGAPAKMGQSPGTHWYHAHKHGSTALNSFNGMSGAFIVEGDYDDRLRAFYKPHKLEEKVLVMQQLGPALNLLTTPAPNRSIDGTHASPMVFVNGMLEPTVSMRPGQVQLWRMLNACGQTAVQFAEIELAKPSSAQPSAAFAWKQTAQDGVQYHWNNFSAPANRNPKITLSPANRADILVQAPSTPGLYQVKTNLVPGPGPNARLVLMTIRVEGEAMQPGMGFPASDAEFPTFPESLADIDPTTIHLRRELTFDTAAFRGSGQRKDGFGRAGFPGLRPSRHTIDGAQFQNNLINQTMLLDTAEEWTLINTTRVVQTPQLPGSPPRPPDAPPPPVNPFLPFAHPFHIHINPFQVTEIFDPVNMDEPQKFEKDLVWFDTIGIPPAYNYYPNGKPRLGKDGKQIFVEGYVKFRSRFVDFPGLFVLHCHILAHEDRGMMQMVQVVPNKTTVEHYH
jgi:FtsP/CotA-like multicopper oxidase with cupredoxin domain